MNDKKLQGAGLRGQSAGETALCTVGKSGSGLTYRGYDIKILAEKAEFEEVAFLLIYGKLPNSTELLNYKTKLSKLREMPPALRQALELIPAESSLGKTLNKMMGICFYYTVHHCISTSKRRVKSLEKEGDT